MSLINCLLIVIACRVVSLIAAITANTEVINGQNLQQKFTTRCDQLCGAVNLNLQEDVQADCQRGCQYFNIEFLMNAANVDKVTDLKTIYDQCKLSCTEAYFDASKRNTCFTGCAQMYQLQDRAPFINGWLVYMGASGTSDRNLFLMQSDLDIQSDEDWVQLDSVIRFPNEYDNLLDQYKLTETRIQTMPIYPVKNHFSIEYCVPPWMWMIPLLLVIGFVLMQYGNVITSIFIQEVEMMEDTERDNKISEEFLVSVDSFMYPAPAVPPPKYHTNEETLLMSSDEEQDLLNYDSSVPVKT